jgi:ABC-type glycerol-3-phosphate transport system substrate-binding protein
LAHPQTFTDFARLLTLPVDSVRKAAEAALSLATARGLPSPLPSKEQAANAAVKVVRFARHPVKETAKVVVDEFLKRMDARSVATAVGHAPAVADAVPLAQAAPSVAVSAAQAAPSVVPSAAQAAPQVAEKIKLTAAEVNAWRQLVTAGKTPQDAAQAIQAAREFTARFQLPSSEQVRQAVRARNASGRWE